MKTGIDSLDQLIGEISHNAIITIGSTEHIITGINDREYTAREAIFNSFKRANPDVKIFKETQAQHYQDHNLQEFAHDLQIKVQSDLKGDAPYLAIYLVETTTKPDYYPIPYDIKNGQWFEEESDIIILVNFHRTEIYVVKNKFGNTGRVPYSLRPLKSMLESRVKRNELMTEKIKGIAAAVQEDRTVNLGFINLSDIPKFIYDILQPLVSFDLDYDRIEFMRRKETVVERDGCGDYLIYHSYNVNKMYGVRIKPKTNDE